MELTNKIILTYAFSVMTGQLETTKLNLAIYFNTLTYMLCLK